MSEEPRISYRHVKQHSLNLTTSLGVLQLGRTGTIKNLNDLIDVHGKEKVLNYLDASTNFFPEEAVPSDTELAFSDVIIDLSGYQNIVHSMIKSRKLDSKNGVGLSLMNREFEAHSYPTIGQAKRTQILDAPYKGEMTLREILEAERAQIKKEQEIKKEKTDIFNMPEPVYHLAPKLDKKNMAQEHLGSKETGMDQYAMDVPTEP